MIGCLIVSLALIVFLVILQKRLPDGAKSDFHLPVRRDVGEALLDKQVVGQREKVIKGTWAPFHTFNQAC